MGGTTTAEHAYRREARDERPIVPAGRTLLAWVASISKKRERNLTFPAEKQERRLPGPVFRYDRRNGEIDTFTCCHPQNGHVGSLKPLPQCALLLRGMDVFQNPAQCGKSHTTAQGISRCIRRKRETKEPLIETS